MPYAMNFYALLHFEPMQMTPESLSSYLSVALTPESLSSYLSVAHGLLLSCLIVIQKLDSAQDVNLMCQEYERIQILLNNFLEESYCFTRNNSIIHQSIPSANIPLEVVKSFAPEIRKFTKTLFEGPRHGTIAPTRRKILTDFSN